MPFPLEEKYRKETKSELNLKFPLIEVCNFDAFDISI